MTETKAQINDRKYKSIDRVLLTMLTLFSGITTFFMYNTFDSVKYIKDDHFKLRNEMYDQTMRLFKDENLMFELHTITLDSIKDLRVYDEELYDSCISILKDRVSSHESRITNAEINIDKVKSKIGLY